MDEMKTESLENDAPLSSAASKEEIPGSSDRDDLGDENQTAEMDLGAEDYVDLTQRTEDAQDSTPEGHPDSEESGVQDEDGPEPSPAEGELLEADIQTEEPVIQQTDYQKHNYLQFGEDHIDENLKLKELHTWLKRGGWNHSALTKARKAERMVFDFLDAKSELHCDFCGFPLSDVSYERLADGRIRCNECSATALKDLDDFADLFHQCMRLLQNFFEIQLDIPMTVRITDAAEVGRKAGMVFRPGKEAGNRVLGFAQSRKGEYSIVMENGAPRLAVIETMVHELTHLWQYEHWNNREVARVYQRASRREGELATRLVYEGMAMWVSVQFLYLAGEYSYASRLEAGSAARTDLYGLGFLLFCRKYPLMKSSGYLKDSPFLHFPPVDPDEVTEILNTVRRKSN